MIKIIAPAAALFVAMGTAAFASEPKPSDPSNCGLNSKQVGNGFYCLETVTVTPISREIGGGKNCQDATRTTYLFQSFNHKGNLQEADDRVLVLEPEDSDWGSSYKNPGQCNY